ncbi:MAG: hypothetical protein EP335_03385 [Alphaproteobacteria bacterium]|nr:MAG: hypothetical protein EP335_03385 [Alphaproteobacteria bacterium]
MTFSDRHYLAGLMAAALVWAAPSVVHAQNAGTLRLQGAQQATYARILIDLPDGVQYSVQKQGTNLVLSIDGQFNTDFSAFSAQGLRQVSSPRATRAGNRTLITFTVPADAGPRDFRSGRFLILDVYSDSVAPQTQSSAPTQAPEPTPTPAPAQGQAGTDETSTDTGAASAGGNSQSAAQATPNDGGSAGTTDIAPPRDNTPPGALRISGGAATADVGASVIAPTVQEIEAGISLTFPWPEEVAAATFERGGFLWVVFDKPYQFDGKPLLDAGTTVSSLIRSVDVIENPDALVLRLGLRGAENAVVERRETSWVISLKDTPAKPRFPLAPDRQAEAAQGQQIFIPASDIGRKIEIEDPAIGDLMVVMPMLREGRGMAQPYSYAAANLLETAQGVVVIPLSDLVNVERFKEGIAIRLSGNDILSATHLSRGEQEGGPKRLIDFAAWRMGPVWEYRQNKALIDYELSLRPADDRNEVRWKLAKYYLAFGRAAECLGVLERMLSEDPLLSQNSDYLAVRGVANFKQGRLEQAAKDLAAKELEAEQDAELWRALVAEALGHNEQALEHYRRGKDVMGTYDDTDRAEIQLAVVRSAIETGDIELAQRELELLNGLDLSEAQLNESIYQAARIAERQGQMAEALVQYDDLANAPQRWIAARSRYSRIKFGLKNGDLQPIDAIDQLERLRYAWRGDRFEVQLIDDLAGLYFQTKQFEQGLELLRQAISYFPEQAAERKMTLRMGQVFRDLFLGSEADKMTPIAAISLFYKFRELTPLGTDGDLMIRRLAERLVSVDLLDRAAELYEYQVRVRTEGAARAQIAATLAKIYILNLEPDKAIEILRATREPRLPEDIDNNRRWVEARALTELGRYEEAEVLLEDDRTQDADTLRADIFWGAKNWSKLAPVVRRLLGDGWRRNESLTSLQRLNLIRLTIALTFLEDRSGLIEMRRRYGAQMRGGDFANAFDLLTNDQELSGRELGLIASQIASVEKLQSFMRDYRSDFNGR